MEQTEIRKKFPIGSILLWLPAAIACTYWFYVDPNAFINQPFNLKYFALKMMLISVVAIIPAVTGFVSLFCKNIGVFICSVVMLAILTVYAILFGGSRLIIPFLLLPGAVAFTFVIFTQAFNIPEKLKAVGAKLFFLPSILFAAAALIYLLVFLIPGAPSPSDSGMLIGWGTVMYWISFYIALFIVIIPTALIALALLFILRRAVDPYKKIKAE